MQYNPYTPAASKKYEIETKIEKYKNTYDELCLKTKDTRNWGARFFDFLPALASFICLTVVPGTCREHEKLLRKILQSNIFACYHVGVR